METASLWNVLSRISAIPNQKLVIAFVLRVLTGFDANLVLLIALYPDLWISQNLLDEVCSLWARLG